MLVNLYGIDLKLLANTNNKFFYNILIIFVRRRWKETNFFEIQGPQQINPAGVLDTGIAAIDAIEDTESTDALFYQLTLEDGSGSLISEYGDYIISEAYRIDDIDEQADNIFIEKEADKILNFTEVNPFGEPGGL